MCWETDEGLGKGKSRPGTGLKSGLVAKGAQVLEE